MSELPRRIVSRIRRFIGNRRGHKRAPVRLKFTLSLADPRTSSNGQRRLPSLVGHTLDISSTGVALIVPAIRIGEHYLVANDRRLHLKLELPGSPVAMTLSPVRSERLEEDKEETGYVIGARITEISDEHRKHFERYLNTLFSKQPE